jgi:hypothetical protein
MRAASAVRRHTSRYFCLLSSTTPVMASSLSGSPPLSNEVSSSQSMPNEIKSGEGKARRSMEGKAGQGSHIVSLSSARMCNINSVTQTCYRIVLLFSLRSSFLFFSFLFSLYTSLFFAPFISSPSDIIFSSLLINSFLFLCSSILPLLFSSLTLTSSVSHAHYRPH